METKIRRLSRQDVSSGRVSLPKKVAFLSRLRFISLLERRTRKGKKVWRVELSSPYAKALIDIYDELQALKAEYNKLKDQSAADAKELSTENERLRDQSAADWKVVMRLDAENKQLNKNLERVNQNTKEDKRLIAQAQRSPKNFFNAASERGFKGRGPPLQGGLPGLGKR